MTHPRFVTFAADGRQRYGLARGDGIVDLSARHGADWPTLKEAIADGALARLAEAGAGMAADFSSADIAYLPPVPAPEKILCVGVNYPERNAEYRDGSAGPTHPSLFVRFPRSFVGHGAALVRPRESQQLDYEGEVALVIGRPGRHVAEAAALDHVAAVTLANDGTLRDWVRHGKFNVTQGKNFDRSGSMGPWLTPLAGEEQIADIRLTTEVNGETRQDDRTGRMLFSFRHLIAYISTFTTLVPGDVILTGTPAGAGGRLDPPVWLKPGDRVRVTADGLGTLENGIVDDA
jgi:2-keto-4-pentenoate hydratase/2-oxohepta-3-ene-1,7-dioic acid hydratase in catechol pathway